ncbi:UDP-glucose 4-epimerase [Orchesella cincta]|uniref:UDP-N-acetylglucosamine 4-epimerase n=1 Tax=Orchesella cincta TaxID=48709 RepID=A0A1D2MHD3_ORCCI|nr:UDP-glucose 4-epimerase [Orchesella cincta]
MAGKTVFVTGGAGYIGSHCCVELLEAGYNVVAVDNFANSVQDDGVATALKRVEKITGKPVTFYKCDLLDRERVMKIFDQHKIDCVIHFAALKAVGESMQLPLQYYKNNLIGTINLLEAMKSTNCFDLVFSSSCCVYGDPEFLPITEEHPTGNVTNVYGRTKYFIEEMLKDLSKSDPKWNIISLRYFNPVGAHPSGLIGEDPTKEVQNVMPFIASVALGKKPHVTIFGNDYNTPDGTGVRDYIHIMDLASGHVAALKKLQTTKDLQYKVCLGRGISVLELIREFEKATGTHVPTVQGERRYGDVGTLICASKKALSELDWVYNLGTGRASSVLDLIRTFELVSQMKVPFVMKERRHGDIVSMYADTTLASEELGWQARHDVLRMCEDFWRWQTMNPNGYKSETAATNGNGIPEKTAKSAFTNGNHVNANGDGVKASNGH